MVSSSCAVMSCWVPPIRVTPPWERPEVGWDGGVPWGGGA